MDERGNCASDAGRSAGGLRWLPAAVLAVFFLAMALWNTSLLDAGSRLRDRLGNLESTLDSLERVQANQLARERILSAEIARLRALEVDVRTKADASSVWILRSRLDTLATQAARLQRETGSPPASAPAPVES